ncbi:MAG: hypothetical protein IKP40_05315 [Clostridia bacterium]|nr:hypothetical protein [Clostridia bacterium]
MSEQDRVDLLSNLYSIVNDLWGGSNAQPSKPMQPRPLGQNAQAKAPAAQAEAAAPAETAPAAPAASAAPKAPAVTPITVYWRTADEPLPWTEALIQPLPRDGLTDEKTWRFCHREAEAVLDGDLAAYGRVLETVQPLSDLAPYTAQLQVRVDSADRLSASFSLTPELSQREPVTNLCCCAIRIARDLLAALPATEIRLEGSAGGKRLNACVRRESLRGVRWGFVEAEALLRELGAVIS